MDDDPFMMFLDGLMRPESQNRRTACVLSPRFIEPSAALSVIWGDFAHLRKAITPVPPLMLEEQSTRVEMTHLNILFSASSSC